MQLKSYIKLVIFLLRLRTVTRGAALLWKISKCLGCISNLGKKYIEISTAKERVS